MTLPEVVMISAKDPKDVQNFGHSWKLVCEDERLSIPYVGKQVRVIDLNRGSHVPPFMGLYELELLLDVCAASLAIETAPTSGPAEEKVQRNLRWYNPTFKAARAALADVNSKL